ncbi:MAG TPA: DUF4402 domain-containing protein [Longimicrobium sp.]|nr:DUF4402 domain-containing protein [Longimicrobium sp.]
MRLLRLLAALPALLCAPALAAAQTQQLQAEALLLAPLEAGAINHLQFGLLVPGTTTEVLATNAAGTAVNPDAGIFQIRTKTPTKFTHVAFLLPASLAHNLQAGVTLPMNWNGNLYLALCEVTVSGCVNLGTGNPSQAQYPASHSYAMTQGGPANRDVMVYLGGKITVPANQLAGNYTGTVTLRFYVTNN